MANEMRLEENTVRYCLYPTGLEENAAPQYRAYIDDCLAKLAPHLANYYWHYTPFNLRHISAEASHSKGMLRVWVWPKVFQSKVFENRSLSFA